MAFRFRENTSSGRQKEPMDVSKETGAHNVGKVLGAGEPGKAQGFRPGGFGPGYDRVGERGGMQLKIPKYRDQSDVHSCKGVDPTDLTQSHNPVEPKDGNA
jgi:hypothetical protein